MIRITPAKAARFQAIADNHGLSKFEHIEELQRSDELAGQRPVDSEHSGPLKIWKTRRREDGKIFLAQEFEDTQGIVEEMREPLLRLLTHPNIVSLIDIVRDSDIVAYARDYTVWEDADMGNLNRVLVLEQIENQKDLPEDLCWHVLSGAASALLYLHHGYKHSHTYNTLTLQDLDWHPVLIGEISPTNIFFKSTDPATPYGTVQLGGFQSALVCANSSAPTAPAPHSLQHNPYSPPETKLPGAMWTPQAEIWSLGAVLCHMMSGAPPGAEGPLLPLRYSDALRGLVAHMLGTMPAQRPTVLAVLKAARVAAAVPEK
ncbi:MAG: hypothetical protein M1829_006811 [Trizodia sp. TS-e1964]|nr:MAG: hypothetical protein M1829_006811 [Trizodia sp. TS-e1964]